jgi:CRISPR-associated protein Csb3
VSIRINVDPANPGQFFACCGLLELADRLSGSARGYFSPSGEEFVIDSAEGPKDGMAEVLRTELSSCSIQSTLTEAGTNSLRKLLNQKKSSRTPEDETEKQRLSELWERERICLSKPFDLWIDWWSDTRSGGSRFKTWAGKQLVIDIVRGMQAGIRGNHWKSVPTANWLCQAVSDGSLPLYFDSDIGRQSASLDVGFSTDALEMRSGTRPMVELAAFAGLQRFRPLPAESTETFSYFQWTEPLPPMLAALACSGYLPRVSVRPFEFRLLYRTKYLKGFLPAEPKGG